MSAIRGRRLRKKPMADINVVPYIDVMLVLLVIFMATAPMMTQGVSVDLPQTDSAAITNNDEPVMITVRPDGSYYINLGDEEEPLALAKIGERTRKVVNANPTIKVLVEGDKSLNYGVIVNLMNVLQLAGATSVGLITEPPK